MHLCMAWFHMKSPWLAQAPMYGLISYGVTVVNSCTCVLLISYGDTCASTLSLHDVIFKLLSLEWNLLNPCYSNESYIWRNCHTSGKQFRAKCEVRDPTSRTKAGVRKFRSTMYNGSTSSTRAISIHPSWFVARSRGRVICHKVIIVLGSRTQACHGWFMDVFMKVYSHEKLICVTGHSVQRNHQTDSPHKRPVM